MPKSDLHDPLTRTSSAQTGTETAACIAGATAGSSSAIISSSEILARTTGGPPILPLESAEPLFYHNALSACNALCQNYRKRFGHSPHVDDVYFAISSFLPKNRHDILEAAVSGSELAISPSVPRLHWLSRGRACWEAVGRPPSAIIVKVGSVAFAHGFRQTPQRLLEFRAGGWGFLSGSDGGGYHIGRKIVYRLFSELDGRTRDGEEIFNKFRAPGDPARSQQELIEELLSWIRRLRETDTVRDEIAALARLAVKLAEEGSTNVVRNIISHAAAQVCRSIQAVLSELFADFANGSVPIYLHGKVVQNSKLFVKELYTNLQEPKHCSEGRPKISLKLQPLLQSPLFGCCLHASRSTFSQGLPELDDLRPLYADDVLNLLADLGEISR